MKLAYEYGQAKKLQKPLEEIEEAEIKLREYEKLCLESDEMMTSFTYGDLY